MIAETKSQIVPHIQSCLACLPFSPAISAVSVVIHLRLGSGDVFSTVLGSTEVSLYMYMCFLCCGDNAL